MILKVFKKSKFFQTITNIIKDNSLSQLQFVWLMNFLRDVGVAIIAGAILGGVIDRLAWQGIMFLLLASLLMCYTSFILINRCQK